MPNPIDIHVGQQIRAARLLQGKSQADIAKALGISFQQVQKYEQGYNRISASNMYMVAKALHMHPADFFDGFDQGPEAQNSSMDESAMKTVGMLSKITNEKLRQQLHALIGEIANRQRELNASS